VRVLQNLGALCGMLRDIAPILGIVKLFLLWRPKAVLGAELNSRCHSRVDAALSLTCTMEGRPRPTTAGGS
jgi:hypothetical protein